MTYHKGHGSWISPTPERNTILDISSDIVATGVILASCQALIYKQFGPGQATVLITFLAISGLWKIINPFTETTTGWHRYLYAVALVSFIVLMSLVLVVI
jgi:hypothetical protein